jgi:uncharacterized membrane protein YgcG
MKRGPAILLFLYLIPVLLFGSSDTHMDRSIEAALLQYGEAGTRQELTDSVRRAIENGISAQNVIRFLNGCAESQREANEVSFYLNRIAELHTQGVPSELLMNSILEGVVKGVSEQDIERTLGPITDRLIFCSATARKHFPRKAKEESVEILVNGLFQAMNLGFSSEDIDTMSTAVRKKGKTPAFFLRVIEVSMEMENAGISRSTTLHLMIASIEGDLGTNDLKVITDFMLTKQMESETEEKLIRKALEAARSGSSGSGKVSSAPGGVQSGPGSSGGGSPARQGGGSGSGSKGP